MSERCFPCDKRNPPVWDSQLRLRCCPSRQLARSRRTRVRCANDIREYPVSTPFVLDMPEWDTPCDMRLAACNIAAHRVHRATLQHIGCIVQQASCRIPCNVSLAPTATCRRGRRGADALCCQPRLWFANCVTLVSCEPSAGASQHGTHARRRARCAHTVAEAETCGQADAIASWYSAQNDASAA